MIKDWITKKILCPVPTAAKASVPNAPTALRPTIPTAAKRMFAKIDGQANPHIDKVSGLETFSISSSETSISDDWSMLAIKILILLYL